MKTLAISNDDKFWAEHAALGPKHVVMAYISTEDVDLVEVFSTYKKAKEWVDRMEAQMSEDVDGMVLFRPIVVDFPDDEGPGDALLN